jgi:hypothetical protein
MSTKKYTLIIQGPLLSGSVSTAMAKCGSKYCRCRSEKNALHGPYYRWIGFLDGKRTTKTVSKEVAEECERRIANFHKFQLQLENLLKLEADSAPWIEDD